MEAALAWLQGLSSPLQILLIVILAVVFKDDIVGFAKAKLGLGKAAEEKEGAVAEKSSKEWFDDVVGMMETLETNHIAHLQSKIDIVHENQGVVLNTLKEIASIQRDTLEILKDFKEYGINCRTPAK